MQAFIAFKVDCISFAALIPTLEKNARAGEASQQLRAFSALAEDLGPIPSTHVVVPNHL